MITSREALRRLCLLQIAFPYKVDAYGNDAKDEVPADCPFFTEAFLYSLVGKEDARTILALMRQLCESLGTTLRDESSEER